MIKVEHTLDLEQLTAVVRQDQRDPSFVLLDWQIETLSTRGAGSADGLLRVSGQGRGCAGAKPWAVALKIIKPDAAVAPDELGYWQREAKAYRSGLLASLPGPVQPARGYGVDEQSDSVWIWMKLLTDSAGEQWKLADYAFAAEQVGRFNGACALDFPLPDAPWLARNHTQVWQQLMSFEQGRQNPQAWQHFPATMQARLVALWAERERFYAALDRLPQLFAHFDYKRSNLFIRQRVDKQREVVAVDWGDCGIGALGGDLVFLVGGSTFFFDWEPERVVELSRTVYDAYLQGLHAAGWRGSVEDVRLAYTAWTAMHFGPPMAAGMDFLVQEENRAATLRILGRPPEEALASYPALCDFALDCADEARRLMAQRGF